MAQLLKNIINETYRFAAFVVTMLILALCFIAKSPKVQAVTVSIIRYIFKVVAVMILVIAMLVCSPIIVIFKWDFIWLLLIMITEWCSYKQAKKLMKSIPKYRFSRWNLHFPNPAYSNSTSCYADLDDEVDTSHFSSPTHDYRSDNNYYHNR